MNTLTRTLTRTAVAAGVVGATILISAVPAHAADSNLDVIGSYVYYTADAGVTNNVKVTRSGDTYLFVETGGDPIVSADPACTYPVLADTTRMQCVVAGLVGISVSVGDLDDAVVHSTEASPTSTAGQATTPSSSVGWRASPVTPTATAETTRGRTARWRSWS